jgi:hypothetical protein
MEIIFCFEPEGLLIEIAQGIALGAQNIICSLKDYKRIL